MEKIKQKTKSNLMNFLMIIIGIGLMYSGLKEYPLEPNFHGILLFIITIIGALMIIKSILNLGSQS